MRRRAKTAPAPSADGHGSTAPTPARSGRPWYGCYVGEVPAASTGDGGRAPVAPLYAGPESAVLVIGPPRSGKTSSLVVPSILDAPAAVVSTSTKPDLLRATALHRGRLGHTFLFDPFATTERPWWMHELRWSPILGCEDFDRATAVAFSVASAARPGVAGTEAGHWVERAQALLAPLLFAAALRDLDMRAVCRWVVARDLREPFAIIEGSGHEMAQATLGGVAATDGRELSGIFSAAAGLLAAYRSEAVLASTVRPNFDPAAFARSTDALYICAPAQHQNLLAPLVVTLLEQIAGATFARPSDAAPVLFALDEVANIAPLPALPSLAAEGGGQGLVTLAAMQDLSQARERWGAAAEGFFTLFAIKVVLPGVADRRTLELISALGGDHEVPKTTVTRYVGEWGRIRPSLSQGTEVRRRLPVDAVARGRRGHALVLEGSRIGEVALLPWWRQPYWANIGNPKKCTPEDLRRYAPGPSE
jgi:type IV secretory pathway TraG/TraD family ATPase VirD4